MKQEAAFPRLLNLPASRAIASQIILGLQFIHSQGIVHGGMLASLPSFDLGERGVLIQTWLQIFTLQMSFFTCHLICKA